MTFGKSTKRKIETDTNGGVAKTDVDLSQFVVMETPLFDDVGRHEDVNPRRREPIVDISDANTKRTCARQVRGNGS